MRRARDEEEKERRKRSATGVASLLVFYSSAHLLVESEAGSSYADREPASSSLLKLGSAEAPLEMLSALCALGDSTEAQTITAEAKTIQENRQELTHHGPEVHTDPQASQAIPPQLTTPARRTLSKPLHSPPYSCWPSWSPPSS